MLNFSQIIEGWKNHLFPDSQVKEMVNAVSKERLSKCKNCPFNSTPGNITNLSRCKACGCLLKPKSKCLSCNCGLERYNELNPKDIQPLLWEAVTSKENDIEIQTKVK